ncbi:MAG TPA: glycosyltransferase family 4 protein [Marmoricola sp.]|nr:glycosyltransferase family 4 protein [Marmoricola sp.]
MADSKRVLVLNHFAAPRGQAGGTRHVELFSRLAGWEYLIIASDLNPQTGRRVSAEPGFAVVHVPAYTSNGVRRILNWVAYAARATILGLRQERVDVVYGSSPHLLAALAAWVIAFIKRVPFVMEVRDLWPQVLLDMGQLSESSPVFRLLTRLEHFLYGRARAIVVMAEGSRSVLVARGIPEAKIHYIPNGADPEDFVASASREALRERYGFGRFTAIYAGAHGPANGLDFLLDAADALADRELDIVLVGGGVQKDSLMARAAREGLDNVRFLDPVPKTEIPDLLAAADLGLHVLADVDLFRSAVSPNKVFDYMAAALPVLTNSPGSVSDLVTCIGCGVCCGPDEIGRAIAQLLDRAQDDGDEMGGLGRSWVSNFRSRTKMSSDLAAVLSGLVR